MNTFQRIADQKEHLGYQNLQEVFSHTVDAEYAKKIVDGVLKFLKISDYTLPQDNNCIDLGCGVGNITKSFQEKGFNISGLEYGEDPIKAANHFNPDVHIEQGDMSTFFRPNQYDFIFSREVYIITRVNAFDDQLAMIKRIVQSLKRGGIFVLIGSDVSFPHCMDYHLVAKTFNKDIEGGGACTNIKYEKIFTHFHKFINSDWQYKMLELTMLPYIYYKKRQGWASQYIIGFKNDL